VLLIEHAAHEGVILHARYYDNVSNCHDLAKRLSHYLYFFSFSFSFSLDLQLQGGAWESIT